MDFETLVQVISRWVHVGTAIVLLGGSVFQRFILMPPLRGLPEAEQQHLRDRVMMRWKKYVLWGMMFLLVTGFYNYLRTSHPPRYHMWMGIKILVAFGVFFLASALTGRSAGLAGIRANAGKWLGILIALAAVVVGIAGYLKVVYPSAG